MKENIDPKMHTAQHLLNQTMVRMFNSGRSFSSHIEKKKSKCDYRFDRVLTPEEVAEIQNQVNKIIQEDLPVTEEYVPREEAQEKYSPGRPIEDMDETVRIVRIGDYDAIPCTGPHVESAKEIGQFRIISSDFNEGVLRIKYKLSALIP